MNDQKVYSFFYVTGCYATDKAQHYAEQYPMMDVENAKKWFHFFYVKGDHTKQESAFWAARNSRSNALENATKWYNFLYIKADFTKVTYFCKLLLLLSEKHLSKPPIGKILISRGLSHGSSTIT